MLNDNAVYFVRQAKTLVHVMQQLEKSQDNKNIFTQM